MRQSKQVMRYSLALIVSLLLLSTTVAVAAGSSSITKLDAASIPRMVTLVSLQVSTTAFQSQHSGKQLCKSHSCKQREWRLHHPPSQYPRTQALASEYGNGDDFLYKPLACGGSYQPSDMGVANKYLPCGTRLKMCYPVKHPKRCVYVTVVDRGPYSGDREFDLQIRPAAQLGFSGVGSVSWEVVKPA